MYKELVETPELHCVSEPQLDLFSYTEENNLEDNFKIVSKNKKIEFESIGKNTLLRNGNCVDYLKFIDTNSRHLTPHEPPPTRHRYRHNPPSYHPRATIHFGFDPGTTLGNVPPRF